MRKPILWRDLMSMSKTLQKELSWKPLADSGQAQKLTGRLLAGHLYEEFGSTDCHLPPPTPKTINTLLLADKQKPEQGAVKLAMTSLNKSLFRQQKTLYWTAEGQKQHALIFGSTGAGLTETMLATAVNAFESGQSVFFMDAKGDNSLYAKVFSHLQRSESLADLVVINLMTGGGEVVRNSKTSHTLDLFGDMNTHELTQWLGFVCDGVFHASPREERSELNTLLPYLAAVICSVSDDTGKPIDLSLIASVFAQSGLEDISKNLRNAPFAHLAGQICARVWAGTGRERIQEKFSTLHAHLTGMASAYSYVFAPQAELCLPDLSEGGRKFVLVLCPSMTRCPDEHWTTTSCILASYLTHVAKKSSIENVVEEMALFNSFSFLMTGNQFARFAQMRGKNVGMVFSGEDNSHLLTFDQLRRARLLPPTTVLMKIERDQLSAEVAQHFNSTHANGTLTLKGLAEQRLGHAVFMGKEHCLPVVMDYRASKVVHKLFITQLPLKDGKTSPPPARLYAKIPKESMELVLMDRINEVGRQGEFSLSWCQETIARMLGYSNLHEAKRQIKS